ncbi:hypothetical protein Tsubulata_024331 [Turnera subulata]|uniref:Cystatin domain-containing protein n=1 Tax=Turnera subulata TaxID=218843 RepID=A0A9Q0F6S7_9ROSI|nr:hypothetical protein Tsubulata_024331 [Turnera subulata]
MVPLDLQPHQSDCQNIMKCLHYAIAENNADPVKPKLEFVRLKKANFSSCAGRKYYITFVAKELDSQKNYTFQAKILYGIRGRLKVSNGPERGGIWTNDYTVREGTPWKNS